MDPRLKYFMKPDSESPMLLRYLDEVGGTLLAEVVPTSTCVTGAVKRRIDGIILPNVKSLKTSMGDTNVYDWGFVKTNQERAELRALIKDEEIVVVQAKNCRLGVYLLGQALFSPRLLAPQARHILKTVALCGADTPPLHAIAQSLGVEVVVDSHANKGKESGSLITPQPTEIERYWRSEGLLVKNYRLADHHTRAGATEAHAIILPDEPTDSADGKQVSIRRKRVKLVTSTKARLGMWAMGKAVFGAELLRQEGGDLVASVILCKENDAALAPLLHAHPYVEVVETSTY